jgi:hypothetical protein
MSSEDESVVRPRTNNRRRAASDASDAGDGDRASSVLSDVNPPSLEDDQPDGAAENDADLFGSGSEDDQPVYVSL